MGVQGLWNLASPAGQRLHFSALENKVVAVDASIWLYHFLKAMRNEAGEMIKGAHLVGFFRRICKLLYLKIKPVFVFDGPPPELKRRTLKLRAEQRMQEERQRRKAVEKLLRNQLQLNILQAQAELGSSLSVNELESGLFAGHGHPEEGSAFQHADLPPTRDEQDASAELPEDGKNVPLESQMENVSHSDSGRDDFATSDPGLENSGRKRGRFRSRRHWVPEEFRGFMAKRRGVSEVTVPELPSEPLRDILQVPDRSRLKGPMREPDEWKGYVLPGGEVVTVPLDGPVQLEEFEQLSPKEQYTLLRRAQDAWYGECRMKAVEAKDDVNAFVNVQLETFLRHIRTNKEIDKVKRSMALASGEPLQKTGIDSAEGDKYQPPSWLRDEQISANSSGTGNAPKDPNFSDIFSSGQGRRKKRGTRQLDETDQCRLKPVAGTADHEREILGDGEEFDRAPGCHRSNFNLDTSRNLVLKDQTVEDLFGGAFFVSGECQETKINADDHHFLDVHETPSAVLPHFDDDLLHKSEAAGSRDDSMEYMDWLEASVCEHADGTVAADLNLPMPPSKKGGPRTNLEEFVQMETKPRAEQGQGSSRLPNRYCAGQDSRHLDGHGAPLSVVPNAEAGLFKNSETAADSDDSMEGIDWLEAGACEQGGGTVSANADSFKTRLSRSREKCPGASSQSEANLTVLPLGQGPPRPTSAVPAEVSPQKLQDPITILETSIDFPQNTQCRANPNESVNTIGSCNAQTSSVAFQVQVGGGINIECTGESRDGLHNTMLLAAESRKPRFTTEDPHPQQSSAVDAVTIEPSPERSHGGLVDASGEKASNNETTDCLDQQGASNLGKVESQIFPQSSEKVKCREFQGEAKETEAQYTFRKKNLVDQKTKNAAVVAAAVAAPPQPTPKIGPIRSGDQAAEIDGNSWCSVHFQYRWRCREEGVEDACVASGCHGQSASSGNADVDVRAARTRKLGRNQSNPNAKELSFLNDDELEDLEIQRMQAECRLETEKRELQSEIWKAKQRADTPTPEMQAEVEQMLEAFGIPFVHAPAEAEAQCAFLSEHKLVDSVVTDDSDVLVFGAKEVYRRLFADDHMVECYTAPRIKKKLGLVKSDLMILAMLLGCDYSVGVHGIGIVNGLEVVRAFLPGLTGRPGGGNSSRKEADGYVNEWVDALRKLREWAENVVGWDDATAGVEETDSRAATVFKQAHRNVRTQWSFPSDFPDPAVIQAFAYPKVDRSVEPFSWAAVDQDRLITQLVRDAGLTKEKILERLEPAIRRYCDALRQPRITDYLLPADGQDVAVIRSTRLGNALRDLQGMNERIEVGFDDGDRTEKDRKRPAKAARKRDGHGRGRGAGSERCDTWKRLAQANGERIALDLDSD